MKLLDLTSAPSHPAEPEESPDRLAEQVDHLRSELDRERRRRAEELERLWKKLSDSELRAADLHRRLATRSDELEALMRSRSWRITAPMRRLFAFLRSLASR